MAIGDPLLETVKTNIESGVIQPPAINKYGDSSEPISVENLEDLTLAPKVNKFGDAISPPSMLQSDVSVEGPNPFDELLDPGSSEAADLPELDAVVSDSSQEMQAPNPYTPDFNKNNKAALNNTIDLTADNEDVKFLNEEAKRNNDRTMMLAEARFSPEIIAKWKTSPIGFGEAYRFRDLEDVVPLGGLYQGYEAVKIGGIANKIRLGEEISESEQKTFDEFLDLEIEKNVRGFTWSGGMGYYGSILPAYIIEFYVSGGIAKTAQVGAVAAVTKGVMVAAETAAAARYTGYIAGSLAATTSMVPMTIRNYGEGRLGQQVYATKEGQALFMEAHENPAMTALKAFGYTYAEVASEMSGAKLAKFLVNPITSRVATLGITQINRLPAPLVNGLFKAYQKLQPSARMSEIITRSGWHGMINELGEERVADILKVYVDMGFGKTFTVDEIWDRLVPSKDQFLIELGLIGTMGAVKTGAVMVNHFLENRGLSREDINLVIDNLTDEQIEQIITDDIYVDNNALKIDVINQAAIQTLGRRYVAEKMMQLEMIEDIEAEMELDNVAQRDKQILKLEVEIKEIRKNALKFRDFIAQGGPLNTQIMIYHGIDRVAFQDRSLGTAQGLKRVWAKNGTQSLSDLTRRYNEQQYFYEQNQEISDTDMLDIFQEWIYSDKPKEKILDDQAQSEIDVRERQVSTLDQLDSTEITGYLNEVYREVTDYTGNEVPVVTESTLADIPIEYAQTLEAAAFNKEMQEYEGFLDELDADARERMYGTVDVQFTEFVGQPELADMPRLPTIDHTISTFASFYGGIVNRFDSVEMALKQAVKAGAAVLPGTNPKLLQSSYQGVIEQVKLTLEQHTFYIDAKGQTIITGIGLQPITDGFDATVFNAEPNSAIRKQDLNKYLLAKRTQQDLQNYTIPGVQDSTQVESEAQAEQAEQAGIVQEALDNLSMQLQEKYDLSAAEVVVKEIEGSLYVELDGKITQDTLNDIYEFADQSNIDLVLNVDSDAYVDGKRIADGTIPGAETALSPKGALVYGLKRSPEASTKVPDLAGPPQKLVGAVQPAFTKDKKFVGPVQERRVTKEQALQAEIDLLALNNKYGSVIDSFETTAQELYAFQTRVLQMFVQSGLMSKQQFDTIISENTAYVPMQRVMLDSFFEQSGYNKNQIQTVLSVLTDAEIDAIIDTGIITQEQYDKVVADDPKVIEILDSLKNGKFKGKDLFSNVDKKGVIQKLIGSERASKEVIGSIISNTSRIIDMSMRNRVGRSLTSIASFIPDKIQRKKANMISFNVDGKLVQRPSPIAPEGTITVFVDGKKQYWEVSDPILDAMQNMSVTEVRFIEKLFAFPVTLFRLGATMIPDFTVQNLWTDSITSNALSRSRPTPIDTVAAISSLMGRDGGKLYNEWRASGGSMGTYMDLSDTGLVKAQRDLLNDESYWKRVVKTAGLGAVKDFANNAERSVRIGVFRASKRKGMSDIEAAFESRQATVDFMRSGKYGKVINRYIPFFNAAVQGTDKLIRALKDNPREVSMAFLTTVTLPSIALTSYYLYGAPDDERKEYLEYPQWVKDSHWIWKQDGEWRQMRKPFAPGFIFGSLPEKFLTWTYQGDKPEGKAFYESVVKPLFASLVPISDPASLIYGPFKWFLENKSNFDFFQGRESIPKWMLELEPDLQVKSSTSETAKVLGKKFGYSPIKIDNFLNDAIAGASKYVTGAGDYFINAVREFKGEQTSDPVESTKSNPLTRRFYVGEAMSAQTQTVSNFYDILTDVKIATNSLDKYTGSDRKEYKEKNQYVLRQSRMIRAAAKAMSSFKAQERKIKASTTLSSSEKRTQIAALNLKFNKKAETALNKFNDGLDKL